MIYRRKYKNYEDYETICNFLKESYDDYETRFDNNLTLFQFQCAIGRGREKKMKTWDEVMERIYLWFHEAKLIGMYEDGSFCLDKNHRRSSILFS